MGRKKNKKQKGGSKTCNDLYLPKNTTWQSLDNTLGSFYRDRIIPNNSSFLNKNMVGGSYKSFIPSNILDITGNIRDLAVNSYNAYSTDSYDRSSSTLYDHGIYRN